MTTNVRRLNHAVLWVGDVARSAEFYQTVLGFEEVERMGEFACFMRAAGSENHHDLAVMRSQAGPGPARGGAVGLYHLAWEVNTIEELGEAAVALSRIDSLVGMSDHGVSKSLYAKDPDGIEFEVLWSVPPEEWGDAAKNGITKPLNLVAEIERYGQGKAATV